ncbi:YIP1 family protein [Desulfocurvus sp. DL9XJH121]
MHITCPKCRFSREVADDAIPETSVFATCPQCGDRFRFRDAVNAPDGSPAPERTAGPAPAEPEAAPRPGGPSDIWQRLDELGKSQPGRPQEYGSYSFADAPPRRETVEVPFEDMERFGFFDGIWETIKRAMRHPGLFFGAMPLGRGRVRPLIFYILLGELSYLALTLWDAAGLDPMQMLTNGGAQPQSDAEFYTSLGGQLAVMFVLPVFYTGYLYISTGIMHLMLRLFRGASSGFEATFKVNCYASAASVLYLVPLVGMVAGSLWQLACMVVGLKAIHQTGYAKIIAAFVASVLAVAVLVAIAALGVHPGPDGAI